MASNAPTILDLKTSFLRAQILALSQPLRPSAAFTASNISDEENTLRQKSIDDALVKLNNQLKQHAKLSYAPQVQRHVAEQVDKLYWNAGERGVRLLGTQDQWADRGADYRHEHVIEQLPEVWSENASTAAPEKAAKFAELSQKLTMLDERRQAARERVERYKLFREIVSLLGEDAGVQDNLVMRDGEVEVELEKMRRLMLRVERGIGSLEQKGQGEEMDIDVVGDGEEEGKIKILALLDRDLDVAL